MRGWPPLPRLWPGLLAAREHRRATGAQKRRSGCEHGGPAARGARTPSRARFPPRPPPGALRRWRVGRVPTKGVLPRSGLATELRSLPSVTLEITTFLDRGPVGGQDAQSARGASASGKPRKAGSRARGGAGRRGMESERFPRRAADDAALGLRGDRSQPEAEPGAPGA